MALVELKFIGCDDYDRPIYDNNGRLFVDLAPACVNADLCTLSGNSVEGEPEVRLDSIKGYEDAEVVFMPCRMNFRLAEHRTKYFKRA